LCGANSFEECELGEFGENGLSGGKGLSGVAHPQRDGVGGQKGTDNAHLDIYQLTHPVARVFRASGTNTLWAFVLTFQFPVPNYTRLNGFAVPKLASSVLG
jgi:hypothetical protein